MEIKMNDKIEITACAMTLALDEFAEEMIDKIENGIVDDSRDIMEFARDKTAEYFMKERNRVK